MKRSANSGEEHFGKVREALVELMRQADAIGPPALALRELVRRFRDPGAALARVLTGDPAEEVREFALMMLFVLGKLASRDMARVEENEPAAIGMS